MEYQFTNYVSAGDGDPVIMIHGLAASLHDWDYLIPKLSSDGYSAYALDLLGHGDSYKPENIREYNIIEVFRHLSTWTDTLNLDAPATLIGHSLGGFLALTYGLRYPERVKKLILVNPYYSNKQLPPILRMFFRRPLSNTTLIEATPYWLFRILVDMSSISMGSPGKSFHSLPEIVRKQTALDYKRAHPGIFNIPRTLRDHNPDELSNLHLKSLVIWGKNDQTLSPRSFPNLVKKLPIAIGKEIPFCGHVPHQCHVEGFSSLVMDFLNTH